LIANYPKDFNVPPGNDLAGSLSGGENKTEEARRVWRTSADAQYHEGPVASELFGNCASFG
jgi:hypothetical protein